MARTSRWRSVALLAAAAMPAALLLPAQPAFAGPTYSKVKVVRVVDGDTVKVDTNGDGAWDQAIRHIGIDTPEHDTCGFDAARRAMKALVNKKTVILRSDTGRTGRQNRPERRVLVKQDGTWVDTTTVMLGKGLGVWMPRKGEITGSRQHHIAAKSAMTAGLGWFDEDRCGVGPGANGTVTMQAQYLADAAYKLTVEQRRNEEFLRIRNGGAEPLDMDGWTLRIGNDRREKVPAGGPIPPGETLTVHIGSGTNSLLHRYMGSSVTMLVDANLDGSAHVGGGSYLIDPDGDIRAHTSWPCAASCVDPTGGALVFSGVNVDPPGSELVALNTETIRMTNTGSAPVVTGDLVVEIHPYVYEFPPGHALDPGESVTIFAGSGQDDRLARYLDAKNPPLHNDGGRVLVRTYDAVVVDCYAWGAGRCPSGS